MKQKVIIYDTTLRDGAASVGLSFSLKDKIRILSRLDQFGIDMVECGYPASNPKDEAFFSRLGQLDLKRAAPVAFGNTRRKKTLAESNLAPLLAAGTESFCIFGKSSEFHVREALGAEPEQNLRMIADSVAFLIGNGKRVIFDAEHFFDGYHENPEYAMECLVAAEQSGAQTVVLCDTNGGMLPYQIESVVEKVVSELSAPVGIHAHNDTGCAVANSLIAVRAGASMVQGTINGYGERCGNADLTTIIPNLVFKLDRDVSCADNLNKLTDLSFYVSEIANVSHNGTQPYVGLNAFGHKGGAHVHALAKNNRSYEHVQPSLVGNRQRIMVSEISGKKAISQKASGLGLDAKAVSRNASEIVEKIKQQENKGYHYEAADGSFEILVRDIIGQKEHFFTLETFRVIVEKHEDGKLVSEATIKITAKGQRYIVTAEGNGPVRALDAALRLALDEIYPEMRNITLIDYKVRVLDETKGTAAVTRVLIESGDGEKTWGTVGVSTNIIEASWQALAESIMYGLLHKKPLSKKS